MKPKVEDFDNQPYGYINALQKYIENQEKTVIEILRQQYEEIYQFSILSEFRTERRNDYNAMRFLCLNSSLLPLSEIEEMELKVEDKQ